VMPGTGGRRITQTISRAGST